jgi:hypothetical protein
MVTKICSKCKEEKCLGDFGKLKSSKDGLMYYCKICNHNKSIKYRLNNKETHKTYLEKNKDCISKYMKDYRKKNKDRINDLRKKYYLNNRETILLKNKQYHKDNKESIRLRKNRYCNFKRKTDTLFYIKHISRKRIYNYLKKNKIDKIDKTFNLIGCSPEFLRNYIEGLFVNGMSWDLMGSKIHIDHKIPLSSAKSVEEVYKLCHYTNLQPLWSIDNIKKGNKII